jgi:hypothetical protein
MLLSRMAPHTHSPWEIQLRHGMNLEIKCDTPNES